MLFRIQFGIATAEKLVKKNLFVGDVIILFTTRKVVIELNSLRKTTVRSPRKTVNTTDGTTSSAKQKNVIPSLLPAPQNMPSKYAPLGEHVLQQMHQT